MGQINRRLRYVRRRLVARLPVEGLFGDAKRVNRRRHSTIKHHLGNNFRDLLLGHPYVQSSQYVPLQQLRAVAQDSQSGNGAQAAGLEVHRRTVVDLAVDNLVHQLHYFRGKFRHSGRRAGISLPAVIPEPEFLGCPAQVFMPSGGISGAAFKGQRKPRQ